MITSKAMLLPIAAVALVLAVAAPNPAFAQSGETVAINNTDMDSDSGGNNSNNETETTTMLITTSTILTSTTTTTSQPTTTTPEATTTAATTTSEATTAATTTSEATTAATTTSEATTTTVSTTPSPPPPVQIASAETNVEESHLDYAEYNSPCNYTSDCQPNQNLECLKGTCLCKEPSIQIYDIPQGKCVTPIGRKCDASLPNDEYMCPEFAECFIDQCVCKTGYSMHTLTRCKLDTDEQRKPIVLWPLPSSSKQESANGETTCSPQCDPSKGLSCQNGTCKCIDPTELFVDELGGCLNTTMQETLKDALALVPTNKDEINNFVRLLERLDVADGGDLEIGGSQYAPLNKLLGLLTSEFAKGVTEPSTASQVAPPSNSGKGDSHGAAQETVTESMSPSKSSVPSPTSAESTEDSAASEESLNVRPSPVDINHHQNNQGQEASIVQRQAPPFAGGGGGGSQFRIPITQGGTRFGEDGGGFGEGGFGLGGLGHEGGGGYGGPEGGLGFGGGGYGHEGGFGEGGGFGGPGGGFGGGFGHEGGLGGGLGGGHHGSGLGGGGLGGHHGSGLGGGGLGGHHGPGLGGGGLGGHQGAGLGGGGLGGHHGGGIGGGGLGGGHYGPGLGGGGLGGGHHGPGLGGGGLGGGHHGPGLGGGGLGGGHHGPGLGGGGLGGGHHGPGLGSGGLGGGHHGPGLGPGGGFGGGMGMHHEGPFGREREKKDDTILVDVADFVGRSLRLFNKFLPLVYAVNDGFKEVIKNDEKDGPDGMKRERRRFGDLSKEDIKEGGILGNLAGFVNVLLRLKSRLMLSGESPLKKLL